MVDSISGINGLIGQVGANTTDAPPYSKSDAPRYAEPQDRVTISAGAKQQSTQNQTGAKAEQDLSDEEKQQVEELKKRDAEVKTHEQAHMAAGGGLVQGGAGYQYEHGPDGKMYAVGGEVKIDVSPERTPEATIRKMQQVQRAALAPAQPSGTDRAVAARAAQMEAQARLEKTENSDETSGPQEASELNKSGDETNEPADAGINAGATATNEMFSYNSALLPTGKRSVTSTGRSINLLA